MSPLNDKDLDRISREAADQYDVDQSASGWEVLESRLNKEMPPDDRDRRRLLFFLLFLVLMAGGGLTWLLRSEQATIGKQAVASKAPAAHEAPAGTGGNGAQQVIVPPGVTANKTDGTGNPQTGGSVAGNETKAGREVTKDGSDITKDRNNQTKENRNNATKNGSNVTQNNKDVTGEKSVTREKDVTNDKVAAKENDRTKNTEVTKKNFDVTKENIGVTKKNADVTKAKNEKGDPGKYPINKNAGLIATNNKNLSLNNNRKQNQRQAAINPYLAPAATITISGNNIFATGKDIKGTNVTGDYDRPVSTIPKPANYSTPILPTPPLERDSIKRLTTLPKKKFIQKFEIGVLAGLDLSNVKFSNAGKGGLNLGLQVGYRFSNRWSVNSGIVYNKKNYKALAKDFAKRGPFRYPIYNINGNCSMLDIPVNVRYDFSVSTKRRYFVSTGLSTYLMDKEYYDYNYYSNGQERKDDWSTSKNTSYLFSILNISAGMERPLGKHFAIQAEPYLKLPLKGVGYGDLQLNSYGINLSLKYKLGAQR